MRRIRPGRIHIVGRKNSGKTTLLCELVAELSRQGFRVATIKHTHHHHELDTPGKDSHRHREAGAVGVGILSPYMRAAFVPATGDNQGDDRYDAFEIMFADCDLILVEGNLQTTALRLEVWRSEVTEPPYAAEDAGIHAVISDDQPPVDASRVRSRADLRGLSAELLQLAARRPTSS